jgi:hypothetical protein
VWNCCWCDVFVTDFCDVYVSYFPCIVIASLFSFSCFSSSILLIYCVPSGYFYLVWCWFQEVCGSLCGFETWIPRTGYLRDFRGQYYSLMLILYKFCAVTISLLFSFVVTELFRLFLTMYILFCLVLFVCLFWAWQPPPHWAGASSFMRFLHHTQRRITVNRTPLDEWLARRGHLYPTTHTTVTTDKHPCPQWDLNPECQQVSGRRAAP